MPSPMDALQQHQFGKPSEVISLVQTDVPVPRAGEVLVRVLASPVNPSDLSTLRGIYGRRPALPASPGYEGVGIVESAGPGLLGRILVGRRVAFLSENGAWRAYTTVLARQAVPLSSAIPLEQAAMFFVNPMTAFALTRKVLKVPKGATLLQSAAGSSLGKMVIRLGKHFGFRTLNVVRRSDQIAELKAIGADDVIATDSCDLASEIKKRTAGTGVAYAMDPVGGPTASAIIKSLAPTGRLVLFGNLSGEPITFGPRDLTTPGAQIEGFWLARWMPALPLLRKVDVVREVGSLMKKGILVSDVGQSFPLADYRSAVTEAEKLARGGKAWFKMGDR